MRFLLCLSLFCFSLSVHADTVQKMEGTFRDTVTLGALDKVTARTSEITLKVGETIKVGTLMIRVIRAWVSDPSEDPESKVFFDITEKKPKKELKTVFKGWMFASNPAVSALEHPVYDVWVKGVSGEKFDGDIPQSETIDPEISERIDDLIDQLMDSQSDDVNSSTEVIEGVESLLDHEINELGDVKKLQDVSVDTSSEDPNSTDW